MCDEIVQKENPQDVDLFVNKKGLSGQYKIKVVCEDKLYDTGVVIQA